jgi:hypothetical protein
LPRGYSPRKRCRVAGTALGKELLMTEAREVAHVVHSLAVLQRGLAALRRKGVIRSQRYLADYGEWLACQLLGGKRALSKTQPAWDIKVGKKRIQVRTHAKADTTPARRTPIPKSALGYDSLLILVLSEKWKLKKAYEVPRRAVSRLARRDGKRLTLHWNHLTEFSLLPPVHKEWKRFGPLFETKGGRKSR